MSAIKKLVLANLEATKARLSEGRQWIGIKNLEILEDVQPRAGISNSWVSSLRRFVEEDNSQFPPAIVYQTSDARLILAAGHHRRQAMLNMGKTDLLCEVIDGSIEEAIVYAAGSNKGIGPKRMDPEDVTKAIEMILGVEKWWAKGSTIIGKQIGCGAGKVIAVRKLYAAKHGLLIPETLETADGRQQASKSWAPGKTGYPSIWYVEGQYWEAKAFGKKLRGKTEREVMDQFDAIKNNYEKKRTSVSYESIREKLRMHGFKPFEKLVRRGSLVHRCIPGIQAVIGHGIVCVGCDLSKSDGCHESIGMSVLALAAGRLLLGRQIERHASRSVVLCYREYLGAEMLAIGEEAGIEFMTPDELIASLGPVIPPEVIEESVATNATK